jgi:valyl-tRNA synthetase
LLCLSQWPDFKDLAKPSADAEINWLVALISDVRSVRSEMNVPASAKIPLVLVGASPETNARAHRHEDTILRMTRADAIRFEATSPKGSAQIVVGETTVCLPLAGIIDMSAEQSRLEKAIAAADSDAAKMSAKLDNPNFMQRASPDAIEEAQERMAELSAQRSKLAAALKRLAGV